MGHANATAAVLALFLIAIMAVGPDLYELIDVIVELRRSRRPHHGNKGNRLARHVTSWRPGHVKVRETAPQICDASEVARVAMDGMMVWPYSEDPLTEKTQGMRTVS